MAIDTMDPEGREPAPSRLRRAGQIALALALGAAPALLLAEAVVRWVSPQPVWIQPADLYAADPPARYRLRPGVDGRMTDRLEYDIRIVTDENGIRVPAGGTPEAGASGPVPASFAGDAGRELRVLTIGDSFTFGVGVEWQETWTARVGAALRAEGVPVRVFDGGVPGYGAPDEAALFEGHLARLHPDLVVLGVYLANDLLDASPASFSVEVRDGALVVGGRNANPLDWLNYHSHLFLLAKNALPPSVQRPLREALGLGPTATQRQIGTEMGAYARQLPPGAIAGRAATDRAYGRLVAATRAAGARLVAVILPEHIAVDPAFWRARLDYLGFDGAGYDPQGPRRIFRELLESHAIPFLDLSDAIEEAEQDGDHLYYPIDTHFTPEGHAVAARQIEPFVREQLRALAPDDQPPEGRPQLRAGKPCEEAHPPSTRPDPSHPA